MIYIVIFTLCLLAIDQLSKYWIVNNMEKGQSQEIINNFFSITSHRNRGAAWGILENNQIFFIVATIIFFIVLIYYANKFKHMLTKFDIISFSLLSGGALGNFVDRVHRKEVVDFLDFNIFGYNYPIFNLADCFICIGVFLILIKVVRN